MQRKQNKSEKENVKAMMIKKIENKDLKYAWKVQKKKNRAFLYQLLCTFELRKFWTEWVQKVAKTDEVSLLTEKFKLSLLKRGIFRSSNELLSGKKIRT